VTFIQAVIGDHNQFPALLFVCHAEWLSALHTKGYDLINPHLVPGPRVHADRCVTVSKQTYKGVYNTWAAQLETNNSQARGSASTGLGYGSSLSGSNNDAVTKFSINTQTTYCPHVCVYETA